MVSMLVADSCRAYVSVNACVCVCVCVFSLRISERCYRQLEPQLHIESDRAVADELSRFIPRVVKSEALPF